MDVDLIIKLGNMLEIVHNDKESTIFKFKECVKPLDKITFGIYLTANMSMFRFCKLTNTLTIFYDNGKVEYHDNINNQEYSIFYNLLNCVKNLYFFCYHNEVYKRNIPYSITVKTAMCCSRPSDYDIYVDGNFLMSLETEDEVNKYINTFFDTTIVLKDIEEVEYKINAIKL